MVSLVPYDPDEPLHYKTHRSILVAVVFHITAGCFNELFRTHPDSKVIQTVLLLVLSIVVVMTDRGLLSAARILRR